MIFSVRNFEKKQARKTIIILSCIVCLGAILLAAVFGTLATKLYDSGVVASNTIDEIYTEIALLRNETEIRLESIMKVMITNNTEIYECLNDITTALRPIPVLTYSL